MRKWSLLIVLMLLIAAFALTAQATTVPEDATWLEIGTEEEFYDLFSGGGSSRLLKENYVKGATKYLRLTDDITITTAGTYYLNSSSYEFDLYFDLNGKTLTYDVPGDSAITRLFGSYSGNSTVTVRNGTLVNSSAITGSHGALFLMSKGNLVMEDLVIRDEDPIPFTANGKIVSVTAGFSCTMTNVDITINNTVATQKGNGGAIRCYGDLTMTDCNLTSIATGSNLAGGLIYQQGGTMTLTRCNFRGGYSKNGGAIYAYYDTVDDKNVGTTAEITDCTFEGNRATGNGGTYCQYYGTATFLRCSIDGQKDVTANNGGNIYVQSAKTTINACTITGGKASYGGSVFSVNETVLVKGNSTISGGYAVVEGGNLLQKNKKLVITSGTVSGGISEGTGGNISVCNAATFELQGGNVKNGKAASGGNIATSITGGSVAPIVKIMGGTVSGGSATNGGNIYLFCYADYTLIPSLSITGGTIKEGAAVTNGGNIYLVGLKAGTKNIPMTMSGGTIADGTAENGGNLLATYSIVTITGGTVSGGSATKLGGSLYPSTAAELNIQGGLVTGGHAGTKGGNIYMSSTSTVVNISGGTVENGVSRWMGGNIYHGNGKLTITGGILTGGEAESYGGNIYAAMGYNNYAHLCGVLTICDDGDPATPLAQITNGRSNSADGGNIYMECAGNNKPTGANKMVLGNGIISGGFARHNGDEIYITDLTILEILPEFSQELSIYIDPDMLPAATGGVLDTGRASASGAFTGKLILENGDHPFIYNNGSDTYLHLSGAAVITADGTRTWYQDNSLLIENAVPGAVLQVMSGELRLAGGDYLVDLAGQNLTITGTGTVTVFDSGNDTYETFGTLTVSGPTLKNEKLQTVGTKQYYLMEENGTYTFHRVEARITSASIRPGNAGLYFTATWNCDAVVAPFVGTYGVAVSLERQPGADFATDSTVLYTALSGFTGGTVKNGALIEGILKDDRAQFNSIYAQMPIFATAYIHIGGENFTGIGVGFSLYDLLAMISDNIVDYMAVEDALQSFMNVWSGKGLTGEPWDQLNFKVPEDIARLNTLYAGAQPYYGELHDHANTGGTSDGDETLTTWKEGLEKLDMDFAAIVDHKQSAHMYLDEWDNSIFIGGSEAATTITDREGVALHYNMTFSDPKGLEAVVSAFPEFGWKYYPEDYTGTNAEKLAGGWHFNYPKFTAERFTELCEAIYANGGFMSIVHPKTGSYVTTENAVDAWFMDQTGIEVFYTGNSTRDGWVTKANYEFWKDLLAAGKKVYATAGNDEHGMPSNKAVSVIYSTERDATAWVNQIRVGNFVAGGVAVRSAVGQTMMGGTTNFEGERLVFAVDEFHSSLYDPTHTYRVDVVSDTGVVFSQELTGEKVFYHAMDADENAAFYYIEIYDVTTDSLLAIGNPIWND